MGPAMFSLALRPGLKRFRQEFERNGVEAFACTDDVPLGLTGITANTIIVFAFLRRELEDIGIVVNTSKAVTLPPKGHAPTAEEISLLQSVDVRVAYEVGVTVVGVSIGHDEYVLDREREIVKEGGMYHLARCLANMRDKQGGPHRHRIPRAEDWLPRTGSRYGAVPRSMQEGRQRGTAGIRENPRATGRSGGTVVFRGGVPG